MRRLRRTTSRNSRRFEPRPVTYVVSAAAGFATGRVVDRRPRVRGDERNAGFDLRVLVDGDRPVDPEPIQRIDQLVGPEPRIGPQRQRARRAGASHPSDQLFDEPVRAPLTRSFPQPRVEHLTGVGPSREQRVVAKHPRVTERSAVFLFAVDLAYRRVHIDRHRPARTRPADHARRIVSAITRSSWRT